MSMSRKERTDLIEKIQSIRGSKVLVYATGDRQRFGSQIAEDAVLPLYNHLLALTDDNYISRLATIRFPGIAPCS